MKNLKEYLLQEEKKAFQGWDFSYMDDRCDWGSLSWDYKERVNEFRHDSYQLLDMGTGGGEFILELQHPYENTSVTEGYEPNYKLCKERLEPLGITVRRITDDGLLPYEDESFDLVINRHDAFLPSEVKRVLKPNGIFITQQVGNQNDRMLVEKIMGKLPLPFPNHDLVHNVKLLEEEGFAILEQREEKPEMKLYDLGVTVYFAKQIPWEFVNFSVEQNYERIQALEEELEKNGFILNQTHRFLIVARK